MILDDVHRGIQKHQKRKRIGRGPGSGHGKTAGRGHKGFFSRSGAKVRTGYEGGQMPMARRIAKSGFSNRAFAPKVAIINLSVLEKHFDAGDEVTPETLAERGLLTRKCEVVKVLAKGKLTKRLSVTAHRFSQSAEEAIAAAGGSVERIPS